MSSAVPKCGRQKEVFHSQFKLLGKFPDRIGRSSTPAEIRYSIHNFSVKRYRRNILAAAQSKELSCANILICSWRSVYKISGEKVCSVFFIVDMRRNKNIRKRCCSIADIGTAFKNTKQLSNQSIDSRRVIIIQNIPLIVIAFFRIDRCLIRLIINNERGIFCWNFLLSAYNLRTMIFTEESQDFAQNRGVLFCNNHERRHHRYAFRFFIDIAFFVSCRNRLDNRFDLVVRAYSNTDHIALPGHIPDTLQACFVSQDFFINTRLSLAAKAVMDAGQNNNNTISRIVGLIDHPDIMCRFTGLNIAEHHAHSFASYTLTGISQSIHNFICRGIDIFNCCNAPRGLPQQIIIVTVPILLFKFRILFELIPPGLIFQIRVTHANGRFRVGGHFTEQELLKTFHVRNHI